MQAEDRNLRVVDQRGREEATQTAGARDGERRVAELVRLEGAGTGTLGEPADLCIDLGDREVVAGADDGDDEAGVGVDGDAEVVAVEQHDLVAVDASVQLRELVQ